MNPKEVEERIMQYIRANSGFEAHRPYLGMSHLSACPRKLYNDYMYGTVPTDTIHLGAYAGYTFEHLELTLLAYTGIARLMTSRELVADFDDLLRGHIDGETVNGDLLELKSLSRYKFNDLVSHNRPIEDHYNQVQAYMLFGDYRNALLVYVERETFVHKAFTVLYNPERAAWLVRRAHIVLDAIHKNYPPDCECGKCQHKPLPVKQEAAHV